MRSYCLIPRTMSTICRLCLQKEESILKDNIFDLHLSDTFYWIYGVEVDVDDPYSKLICKKCQNITNYIVRVRKQFQTNQFILKEKRCPLDYDVDLGCMTKDVGTSTENSNTPNNILVSFDTLSKLSKPFVNVTKLEHTNLQKEYQRISKYSFRRRKIFQKKKGNSKGNDGPGCSRAENIPNTSSSTQTRSGCQRLHDGLLGRVQIKTELTEISNETQVVNTDTEARSRPVLISRATNTTDINNSVDNENITSISANTLKQLFSPTIHVQRLEDGDVGERYEKVDDVTYRLMPPVLESQLEEGETKRMSYMDYYYKIPTSALKELIIERHNELSGDQNSIAINNCKEKEVSLFEPKDVLRLEHCKQCNQTFKTKDMLTIHCHFKHKKPVQATKPRKRRKRCAYSKPKRYRKNPMPQLVDEQGQKMGVVESKAATGWSHPKKITDLFSSFDQSRLSNQQLWLDDSPAAGRVVADNNKEQSSEPEKVIASHESRKDPPCLVRPEVKTSAVPACATTIKKLPAQNRSVLKTLLLDKERINKSRPITLDALKSTEGVGLRQAAIGAVSPQPSTSKGPPKGGDVSLARRIVKYIGPVKGAVCSAGTASTSGRGFPVAACSSSSSVQPEIVWFPDLTNNGAIEVERVSSDEESGDRVRTLRNGLSSALSVPSGKPVRETVDVVQRLCHVRQTRAELESMKKVRTVLQRRIEAAPEVDTKYGFIMNLLK